MARLLETLPVSWETAAEAPADLHKAPQETHSARGTQCPAPVDQ